MRVSVFFLGELLIRFPVVLSKAVLEVFCPNGETRKFYILNLSLFLRHLTRTMLNLS